MGGFMDNVRHFYSFNTIFSSFGFNRVCCVCNVIELLSISVLIGIFYQFITIQYVWWPIFEVVRIFVLTIARVDVILKNVEDYEQHRNSFQCTRNIITIVNFIGAASILVLSPLYFGLLPYQNQTLLVMRTVFITMMVTFIVMRIILSLPMFWALCVGQNLFLLSINEGYQRIGDRVLIPNENNPNLNQNLNQNANQSQNNMNSRQFSHSHNNNNNMSPNNFNHNASVQQQQGQGIVADPNTMGHSPNNANPPNPVDSTAEDYRRLRQQILIYEQRQMELAIEESKNAAFSKDRKSQDDEYQRALANQYKKSFSEIERPPVSANHESHSKAEEVSTHTNMDIDDTQTKTEPKKPLLDSSSLPPLSPEIEASSVTVTVRIRLPNGVRCERIFLKSATIASIHLWVKHECVRYSLTDLYSNFQLLSTMPRTVYSQMGQSMEETGFWRANSKRKVILSPVLYVEEIEAAIDS